MAANVIQAVRNTIYVSNLPWTVGANELKQYFSKFGAIARTNVIFDKDTGLSKRFGFVTFKNDDSVKLTFQCDDHLIDGKTVNIALRKQ